MLPDDWLAHASPKIPRIYRERIAAAWRNAQRFVFSEKASEIAGKLRHDDSVSLIIEHRMFAIPPYRVMYVEVDNKAFMAQMYYDPRLGPPDERVGYLIDNNDVYVFAGVGKSVGPSTWHYRFGDSDDTLWAESDDYDWPFIKLAVLLGAGAATVAAQRAKHEILASVSLKSMIKVDRMPQGRLINLLKGSFGDIANLWCFLLWLNRPQQTVFSDMPRSRGISRGKLRTYSAYRTVEIDLGKFRKVSRAFLAGASRLPPRLHSVRGSFHHHGGLASGCGHDWVALPSLSLWQCKRCERKRWWVQEHERGDITRGRVVHDYDVNVKQQ